MSFGLHNPLLASDFIDIKARVKAECERRQYNGSVAEYAGSSYDYTVQPSEESVPLPEHLNKIIVPLNAISNTGFNQTQRGYLTRDISSAEQLLTSLESIPLNAAESGCQSSCTGLCQGACWASCTTGCSTGCGSSCERGCGGACENSCSSSCAALCRGTCKGLVEYNPVE